MQLHNSRRGGAQPCASAAQTEPNRSRILLLAPNAAAAEAHAELLRQDGFDLEILCDSSKAAQACRRRTRPIHLIVLIESEATPSAAARAVVETASDARRNLPCILLPATATAEECRTAVRTALRWTSVAYVSAAAGR